MTRLLAPALLLALLAACSSTGGTPTNGAAAQPAATEAACTQQGGEWTQLGRLPAKRCLLKTADAGKACSDSAQCEGGCLAPAGTADGAQVAGTCSIDNNPFGCTQRVRDGVSSTICVD